jgi:hypothetical protein
MLPLNLSMCSLLMLKMLSISYAKALHVAYQGRLKRVNVRQLIRICVFYLLLTSSEYYLDQFLSTEIVLFKFLEQYLRRLEGPLAVQVWGRFLQLVKDVSGSARDFKAQNFPALWYVKLRRHLCSTEVFQLFDCLGRKDYANHGYGR